MDLFGLIHELGLHRVSLEHLNKLKAHELATSTKIKTD